MFEVAREAAVIEPDHPNMPEALAELYRQHEEAALAAEYRERAEKLKAGRARVMGQYRLNDWRSLSAP